jgi:hypothetical protein
MATGENNTTWGDVTNLNLGTALEEAIVGSADVTFASADVTLTLTDTNASQTARNMRLRCTGTTGGSTRNLIVPSIEKPYIVRNDCADSVVVKTAAGTGITVPAGKTMWVYSDATNVVDAVTHLSSLTLSTPLPVSSGGTGVNTSLTAGSVVFAGASGAYSQDNANFFWDDTNNRLGIGTATPSFRLQVETDSDANTGIYTRNSNTGTSAAGVLTVASLVGTVSVRAHSAANSAWPNSTLIISDSGFTGGLNLFQNGANPIRLWTNGSERMRVDASGNVGIGTSSPGTKLTVAGASEAIRMANATPYLSFYNAAQSTRFGYIQHNGTNLALVNGEAGSLDMYTSNTLRATVTSAGDVGIGTTSYGGKLTIIPAANPTTASASTNQIALGEASNNTAYRMNIGYIFTGGYASSIQSIAGSVPAYLLLNADGGNVGIGTYAPQDKLEVFGGNVRSALAGTSGATFRGFAIGQDTTEFASLKAEASFGETRLTSGFTGFGGFTTFHTNGTERMRITSAGKVGIGTTGPNEALQVSGTIGSIAGSGSNGFVVGDFGSGAGTFVISAITGRNLTFVDSFAGVERMRIDSGGNVGIGTTTPRAQLDVGTNASGSTTSTLHLGYSGLNFYGFRIANTMDPSLESAGTLSFQRGTTSAWSSVVTISDVGNVGVGVTPSAASLPTIQTEYGILSGNLQINTAQNAYYSSAWRYIGSAAAALYNQTSGAHSWQVAPSGTAGNTISFTAAMTLTNSGNLLVGKTAVAITTVGGEMRSDGGISSTRSGSTNATSTFEVYSTGAGAYRFFVDMAGNVNATSTSISAISDIRLKENVRDLDTGLDTILALKPRRFDWKEGKGKDVKDDMGFIAQEVETVLPELIGGWKAGEGEPDDLKSVKAGDLIPVLVKAIQELTARVAQLEGN